jgi:hypothetical protein
MSDGYTIHRGDEFLIIEQDGISWSRYKIDATFFDTQEEADAVRIKLGLVMCGTGWHSNREVSDKLMFPPREQRITPGRIGHPTGGKLYSWMDIIYEIADTEEKARKN